MSDWMTLSSVYGDFEPVTVEYTPEDLDIVWCEEE